MNTKSVAHGWKFFKEHIRKQATGKLKATKSDQRPHNPLAEVGLRGCRPNDLVSGLTCVRHIGVLKGDSKLGTMMDDVVKQISASIFLFIRSMSK